MLKIGLNNKNTEYVEKEQGTWFEYRTGNILDQTDLNFIVHQANCFCCMGGGVAFALSKCWPEVARVDNKTEYGDIKKLGTYTVANVKQQMNVNHEFMERDLRVINLYSQYSPGPYNNHAEKLQRMEAMKQGLLKFREDVINSQIDPLIENKPVYVGIPWLIGCGISGLDMNEVFELIKEIFQDYSHVIKIIFVDFN